MQNGADSHVHKKARFDSPEEEGEVQDDAERSARPQPVGGSVEPPAASANQHKVVSIKGRAGPKTSFSLSSLPAKATTAKKLPFKMKGAADAAKDKNVLADSPEPEAAAVQHALPKRPEPAPAEDLAPNAVTPPRPPPPQEVDVLPYDEPSERDQGRSSRASQRSVSPRSSRTRSRSPRSQRGKDREEGEYTERPRSRERKDDRREGEGKHRRRDDDRSHSHSSSKRRRSASRERHGSSHRSSRYRDDDRDRDRRRDDRDYRSSGPRDWDDHRRDSDRGYSSYRRHSRSRSPRDRSPRRKVDLDDRYAERSTNDSYYDNGGRGYGYDRNARYNDDFRRQDASRYDDDYYSRGSPGYNNYSSRGGNYRPQADSYVPARNQGGRRSPRSYNPPPPQRGHIKKISIGKKEPSPPPKKEKPRQEVIFPADLPPAPPHMAPGPAFTLPSTPLPSAVPVAAPVASNGLPSKPRALFGCSPITHYKTTRAIGEGTFGVVTLATVHIEPTYIDGGSGRPRARKGDEVALKKIIFHNENDGMPITALREIRILKTLNHPNVVPVLDMAYKEGNAKELERGETFMVFPYMDHDLAGLLENQIVQAKLRLPLIKLWAKQLVEGTHYLHANSILHRDLKAANLLIDNKGTLMIADFGLARSLDLQNVDKAYTGEVVTRWYRPPELCLGARVYGTAVDMWGVGCIIIEMCKGTPIFPGQTEAEQLEFIFGACGTPDNVRLPEWESLPGAEAYKNVVPIEPDLEGYFTVDVLSKLKNGDPTAPPDKLFWPFMRKLVVLDPAKRLTAELALMDEWFYSEPLPADPAVDGPWEFPTSHEADAKKTSKKREVERPRKKPMYQQPQESGQPNMPPGQPNMPPGQPFYPPGQQYAQPNGGAPYGYQNQPYNPQAQYQQPPPPHMQQGQNPYNAGYAAPYPQQGYHRGPPMQTGPMQNGFPPVFGGPGRGGPPPHQHNGPPRR